MQQKLRAWGRRAAERWAKDDDRVAALVSASAGAVAIRASLLLWAGGDATATGATLVSKYFAPIAGAGMALAVAPKRWHYVLQSAAVAALFVVYQLGEEGSRAKNLTTFAMWAATVLLLRSLPLRRPGFRRPLIVVVTLALPLFARRLSFEQGVVLIQFLFAAELVAKAPARSLVQCLRATCAPLTMMPPSDLAASRRSGATIALGASQVAVGVLGLVLLDRAAPCRSSPFFFCAQSIGLSISERVFARLSPASLAWAAIRDVAWILNFALQYVVLVGILNFLGVPMRFITGNMLRVRNLFDYWKTANRWQYELLRSVYLDNFFAIGRGWRAAAGIVLVFVLSGVLHLPGRAATSESMATVLLASEARWVVFGVLCAISYQYRVYSVRRRLEASLRGAATASGLATRILAAPSLFAVLCISGLLIAGDEWFAAARPYWIVSLEGPEGVRKRSFYESRDYGGPIRPADKLPNASSRKGPALASLGDELYVAFWDGGGSRWSRLRNGSWAAPQLLSASAKGPPALAGKEGRLFAAWPDTATSAVRWAMFADGAWTEQGEVPGARAAGTPSLVASGPRLYLAWTAADGDGARWSFFDGRQWSHPLPFDVGARPPATAPALADDAGSLVAVWRGGETDRHRLFWSKLGGTQWTSAQPVPGAETSSDPSATTLGRRVTIAWRGTGFDPDIQWASLDGTWSSPARTGLSTCRAPAIGAYRGYLVLAWAGKEATRCEAPSDLGGSWDRTSVYAVDLPRSSSDPNETPGRVVWRTLRTTDPDAAAAFYGAVVGWRVSRGADGTLTLSNARGPLGDIVHLSDGERRLGVAPFWQPSVGVDSVEATVARAASLGAETYPGRRRDGSLLDAGLVYLPVTSVLLTRLSSPAALHDSSEPGDFHGSLLVTSYRDAALRFYADLFGWTRSSEADVKDGQKKPRGHYIVYARGETEIGTMRVSPAPVASRWLPYVEVDDIDAAVARATARGGYVTSGPMPSDDGGRLLELVDPQGANVGLHERPAAGPRPE